MNYFIHEKENCIIIYIDISHLKILSQISDLIDDRFHGSVIEVTHNFVANQGSIILRKESAEYIDKIKELLDM